MRVPVAPASAEQVIRGSRFLSESFPVGSQAEARERLAAQKRKYADATHVCHAFICGRNAEVMGAGDDGEPGGTAGRPILDVLKGSGCTNLIVTVTRWFGGTLLGTGGLVRAYGDGAKAVLAATPTEELVEKARFSLECDYQLHRPVMKVVAGFRASGVSESFGESVSVLGTVPAEEFDALSAAVFDRTGGRVSVARG